MNCVDPPLDSRVCKGIQNIRHKVSDYQNETGKHNVCHDNWIVSLSDCFHRKAADTRPAKHAFNDERATDQRSHVHTQNGDDRQKGVFQNVLAQDFSRILHLGRNIQLNSIVSKHGLNLQASYTK